MIHIPADDVSISCYNVVCEECKGFYEIWDFSDEEEMGPCDFCMEKLVKYRCIFAGRRRDISKQNTSEVAITVQTPEEPVRSSCCLTKRSMKVALVALVLFLGGGFYWLVNRDEF